MELKLNKYLIRNYILVSELSLRELFFLVIAIVFFHSAVNAQSPLSLTTQDGLPSNSVYRAVQDKEGVMWFCTEKGLSKFDGYEFTNFNTNNGLPHNDIFYIYLQDDKIWLSTFDSVAYIQNDKVIGVTKTDEIKDLSLYRYMFEGKDISLVYFQKARKYYRINNDSLVEFKLPSTHRIFSIVSDNEFSLIRYDSIHDTDYIVKYIDSKEVKQIEFEHDISILKYESIIIDNKKYLFEKDSVLIWDGNQLEGISYVEKWGEDPEHYKIVQYGGIIVLFGNKNSYVLDKDLNILKGYDFLLDNNNNSFTIDQNNNFWTCGSEGVRFYRNREIGSLSHEMPYEGDKFKVLVKGPSQQLYIATEDGRVMEITEQDQLVGKIALDLKNVKDMQIDKDGTYYYILDKSKGLIKYSFSKSDHNSYGKFLGNMNDSQKTFDLSADGDISIGYSFASKVIGKYGENQILSKRTYSVKYQEDTIWIGTTRGLYKYFDNHSELFSLDKREPYIKYIYLDNHNAIWAIPDRTGLYRIENGNYKNLTFLDDLYINKLRVDQDKNLWLATTSGLFQLKYDKSSDTYSRIKYGYSKGIDSENISDVEIRGNKVYAISDKMLYALDINQENRIKNTHFLFSNITVNQEEVEFDEISDLKYTENELIINYKCISLDDFGKVKYKWKLEPIYNEWQETKARTLQFNSLAPNSYNLKIKSFDSNDELIHKEETLSFIINSPWYLTKLFLILVGLFTIASFKAYDIWRKNKERKKLKLENTIQQQLYELKLRAVRAQMNPHFIFNALNSIQKFIFLRNPEEANEYIVKFSKLMRMILESTNERFTSISIELNMLEIYMSLEQLRFDNIFDFDIEVDPNLDRQNTFIPSIMLQPFVENAINHGLAPKESKGKLWLRFRLQSDNLICEIEDNGIGREKSKLLKKSTHTSRALSIIKERKEILKESDNYIIDFIFEDLYNDKKEPTGTKMVLTLPLIFDYVN
jgi:hypothetical protein